MAALQDSTIAAASVNVPDFPNDNEITFPNSDDEAEETRNRETIRPFRDVPMYIWLRIISYRLIRKSVVMRLQRQNGDSFDAWGTSLLDVQLPEEYKKTEKRGKFLFIKSIVKRTAESTGRDYYKFKFFQK